MLTHSLDLAPRLTGELGVLDRIAVPGDWVVRKGAQLDAVVSELERIVRNLGYSGIRIAPQDAAGPVIIAYDGAPASESVLRIFAAPEGVEPAPVESGTIAQCLDAISAAVGVPIRKQLSDDGEHCVLWENNAPIRVQLGLLPTDDDRQSLLQETSATLGVLFDFDLEVRRQWRVDWEGALPPPLRGKTPPPPK
ncbi:MAG: hypothetical protein HZB38_00365 [Planctomycetes bacterium]|nr:hypothetical protein [Planctomycetota bacterium]